MATRRMLSADLFEDEFIGTLTFFQRLVWSGIIVACADDQGRLQNSPALIRSKVFPFDDVSLEEIARAIEIFARDNKLVVYEAGGKSLCQIRKWWTYQTPNWASPSKFDPPPNWLDRFKYHAAGNKIITQNWDKPGGWASNDVQASPLEAEPGSDFHSPLDGEPGSNLHSPLHSALDSPLHSPLDSPLHNALDSQLHRALNDGEDEDEVKNEDKKREREEEEGEFVRTSAPAAAAAFRNLSDHDAAHVFTSLSGLAAVPESSRAAVISAIQVVAKRFERRVDFLTWLEKCRDAWRSRRYNLTNTGWITDWALQGSIPKSKEQKVTHPEKSKRYDQGLYSEFIDNG